MHMAKNQRRRIRKSHTTDCVLLTFEVWPEEALFIPSKLNSSNSMLTFKFQPYKTFFQHHDQLWYTYDSTFTILLSTIIKNGTFKDKYISHTILHLDQPWYFFKTSKCPILLCTMINHGISKTRMCPN